MFTKLFKIEGYKKNVIRIVEIKICNWLFDIPKVLKIKNTEDAVSAGAFGVPTFFLNNQIFWGKEALREMPDYF